MQQNFHDPQTQAAWNGWVKFTRIVTYVSIATAVILLLLAVITL